MRSRLHSRPILCARCGLPVDDTRSYSDATGRAWHAECMVDALAEHPGGYPGRLPRPDPRVVERPTAPERDPRSVDAPGQPDPRHEQIRRAIMAGDWPALPDDVRDQLVRMYVASGGQDPIRALQALLSDATSIAERVAAVQQGMAQALPPGPDRRPLGRMYGGKKTDRAALRTGRARRKRQERA